MLDRLEAERLDRARAIHAEETGQTGPDRAEVRKARPAIRWRAADARDDGCGGAVS
ncbi:hypothetical protein Q9Q95_13995 [Sphingomonas sp. DG1-23]|uniref:hypothetical protein n=1 Tax=Sphingomonas sp. DG1-23 TaxID=3068316 RepID=UPI00273EA7F0|nr:hypothetical protein [Sphingomonas sp. DG1-23]MDP5280041.1 hypothetical protein [Sphingomonas sp. DG1-23]